METDPRYRTTALLTAGARGQRAASDELFGLLQRELRAIAASYLARERPGHTLQPTALVNEAYMRLIRSDRVHLRGKQHFRALCARAMRQVLIDYGRAHNSGKRLPDPRKVTLEGDEHAAVEGVDLFGLLDALEALGKVDERRAKVVELRYFGGLDDEEIGAELGITGRTVRNDWRFARAWLRSALQDGER